MNNTAVRCRSEIAPKAPRGAKKESRSARACKQALPASDYQVDSLRITPRPSLSPPAYAQITTFLDVVQSLRNTSGILGEATVVSSTSGCCKLARLVLKSVTGCFLVRSERARVLVCVWGREPSGETGLSPFSDRFSFSIFDLFLRGPALRRQPVLSAAGTSFRIGILISFSHEGERGIP